MEEQEVVKIIEKFDWKILSKIYGSGHSSIIGFIASEWIKINSNTNSVLDGPTCVEIKKSTNVRRCADIVLCKDQKPLIVVEVETDERNYNSKIKTLKLYIKEKGCIFGILFMANCVKKQKKSKRNKCNTNKIILINQKKELRSLAKEEKNNFFNKNKFAQKEVSEISCCSEQWDDRKSKILFTKNNNK